MIIPTVLSIITFESIYITLFYTIIPFFIGFTSALMITAMRLFLNLDIKFIIVIIRGTPLLVQLYFWKYCFFIHLSSWKAGLIAFSINSAIHIVEILRGAINNIDKGQWEVAKLLSIPNSKLLLDIIIPQAITTSLPSLINELSSLLKESAIVSMIGETDIMRRAMMIGGSNFQYTVPVITAGMIYLVIFIFFEKIALFFARKIMKNM